MLGILAAILLAPISHVLLMGLLVRDNGPLERATDGSPPLLMFAILVWVMGWFPGVALCSLIIDRFGNIAQDQKLYAVYILPLFAGLIGVFALDYDVLASLLKLK